MAAKGESAEGLTDEMRSKIADLGLDELSALEPGESYVGIIDGGIVREDERSADLGESCVSDGAYRDFRVIASSRHLQPNAALSDAYSISSAGSGAGDDVSIVVGSKDRAAGGGGLNFVVYNKYTRKLIDASSFDTHETCNRNRE